MPISQLPVPPYTGDPNFETNANNFLGAFPTLRNEINAAMVAYGPGAPFCTAGGSANAITLTSGLSLTALVAGQSAAWVATAANTAATTINLDGIGAVSAVTPAGAALPAGWITSGQITGAIYNGTAFVVPPSQGYLDAQSGMVPLSATTVSAGTSAVDVVFGTAYRSVELHFHNLVPATDGANLWLRLGNGSGVMDAGASDYDGSYQWVRDSSPIANAVGGMSAVLLAGGVSSAAGAGISGRAMVLGSQDAATRTQVTSHAAYENSITSTFGMASASGGRNATGQHQSVRLMWSTGNFTSGLVAAYGYR